MTARRTSRRRGGAGGFTLIEVMLALAILALGLTLLLASSSNSINQSQYDLKVGVIADLARGKMYDLEEQILKDGFQETNQELDGDFSDEGWPEIEWEAKIEKVELPGNLAAMQQGEGKDGKAGTAGPESPLGGLMGMMGGMGGGGGKDEEGGNMATGAFLTSQFDLVKRVLEASIRRVTVVIHFEVGSHKETFDVTCYFTDPASVKKVISIPNIPPP